MRTITEAREITAALLDGAARKAPRSVQREALARAARAMRLAEIACGEWGPTDDGYEAGAGMDAIDIAEELEADKDSPRAMESLENGDWNAATIERSRIDRDYLRICVGPLVLIVEQSVDGGYGDDGTGFRQSHEIRLHGERRTADV